MREFDSQYGLYFTSNKVMPNNSHQPIKIQAYCRNGNNKLSAEKTYKFNWVYQTESRQIGGGIKIPPINKKIYKKIKDKTVSLFLDTILLHFY